MKRRLVLTAAGAGALHAVAAQQALPLSVSLRDELAAALALARPLLVLVSLERCPYCQWVRAQYLLPLHARDRQPMVQVDMRSARPILDASGEARTHDELVRAWRIDAAPTLLFLGDGGRELAERLRGVSIPDFYGAYFDERLAAARRAVVR